MHIAGSDFHPHTVTPASIPYSALRGPRARTPVRAHGVLRSDRAMRASPLRACRSLNAGILNDSSGDRYPWKSGFDVSYLASDDLARLIETMEFSRFISLVSGLHLSRSPQWPKLAYGAAEYAVAYATSVWFYFFRRASLAWFAEMHRIIKPGGVLMFTAHGLRSLSLAVQWEAADYQVGRNQIKQTPLILVSVRRFTSEKMRFEPFLPKGADA